MVDEVVDGIEKGVKRSAAHLDEIMTSGLSQMAKRHKGNDDETALLSFERWAPGMPWEISTGKSVLTGELTVYPAPPPTA